MATLAKPAAVLFEYLIPAGLALPRELSFDGWAKLGTVLGRVGRALPWAVGDWVCYGEDQFGERYSQALEVTGLDHATIANYAWVCRAFLPRSRRREPARVAFSLHAELAALALPEQDAWLDRIEREGLSRSQLRELLGKRKGLQAPPHPPHRCATCGTTWEEE